jgi:integrase
MLDKPFAKVAEAINLGRKVTSHDARRTFNTLARQAQVPDRVIQAIVGHHSDAMTERYDRVEVRERRQAIGKVIEFAKLATKVGGQVGGVLDQKENAL